MLIQSLTIFAPAFAQASIVSKPTPPSTSMSRSINFCLNVRTWFENEREIFLEHHTGRFFLKN